MLRICRLTISILCGMVVFGQQTPQQIQQHQMAVERALQRDAAEREEQRHQAQIEQERRIDRQQDEDARQRTEKARADAIAQQENLYLLQQAEQARAQAKAKAQVQSGQSQPAGGQNSQAASQPASQEASQQASQQASQPHSQDASSPGSAHWSFSNMTGLEKAGLGALGVVLVALAFAAGIIPAKLVPMRRSDSRNMR